MEIDTNKVAAKLVAIPEFTEFISKARPDSKCYGGFSIDRIIKLSVCPPRGTCFTDLLWKRRGHAVFREFPTHGIVTGQPPGLGAAHHEGSYHLPPYMLRQNH